MTSTNLIYRAWQDVTVVGDFCLCCRCDAHNNYMCWSGVNSVFDSQPRKDSMATAKPTQLEFLFRQLTFGSPLSKLRISMIFSGITFHFVLFFFLGGGSFFFFPRLSTAVKMRYIGPSCLTLCRLYIIFIDFVAVWIYSLSHCRFPQWQFDPESTRGISNERAWGWSVYRSEQIYGFDSLISVRIWNHNSTKIY